MSKNDIKIPLDYTKQTKTAINISVTVAKYFCVMVENFLIILITSLLNFQSATNSKQVRTSYFKD